METVLKHDSLVSEWPVWAVKTTSNVSLDGQHLPELFSMIHRQIDVLRHYSQSHESQLVAVLGQMDDLRERFERENSKLHDRVDRVIRIFEEQFSSSALEQRLSTLESKINLIDAQVQLIKPSPVQSAIINFREQKDIYDAKIAELEKILSEHVNTPHANASQQIIQPALPKRVSIFSPNFEQTQLATDHIAPGSLIRSRSASISRSGSIHSSINHAVQLHGIQHQLSNDSSADESTSKSDHRSFQQTLDKSIKKRRGKLDTHQTSTRTMNTHQVAIVSSDMNAISEEENQPYLAKLENKLETAVETAFQLEERIIDVEGGIIALDSRIKEIDVLPKEQTFALISDELREMKIRLNEAIDKKIQDIAIQKANISDVKGKADLSLVLKKADEVQVRRLDDLVKDLDRKVILLTRDFEEGIESVQKKSDKKLEFMTQWIIKHVKKIQVTNKTSAVGDAADIGKTKCLVCDQPVREMEKETPYSTKAFKTTMTEQRDVKRAMKLSNSAARLSNTNASNSNKNTTTTSNNDPSALDPDGPWQQRTFFTGGSSLGQMLAMQNNTSHNAFSPMQDSPTRVPGVVHVPPSKMQREPGQLMSPVAIEAQSKPETNSAAVSNGLNKSDSFNGVFLGAKQNSRPSSAPAGRKDKIRGAVSLARVME